MTRQACFLFRTNFGIFRAAAFVLSSLVFLGGLAGCAHLPGMTRLPESSLHETLPQNPERSGDLARILEGQYQLRSTRREDNFCGRNVQVYFHLERVEWIEPVFTPAGCRQQGELRYRGKMEIGEITPNDALSRKMAIRMESVEYQAREVIQFSPYTQVDTCRVSQMVAGQVLDVTGRHCGWMGAFPMRDQIVTTRIRMNSGQAIQIQALPLLTRSLPPEPNPRREPASAASLETLSFDRVTL